MSDIHHDAMGEILALRQMCNLKLTSQMTTNMLSSLKSFCEDEEKRTDYDQAPLTKRFLRYMCRKYADDEETEYINVLREMYTRINNISIGRRIKAARKAKGMSQTVLAEHLNKTLRSIQKYERGEVEVSLSDIDMIADILDVSSAYLLWLDNPPQARSLADILAFVNDLTRKEELNINIAVHYPDIDKEWKALITVDGTDNAEHNSDLVSMLQQYTIQKYTATLMVEPVEYMEQWMRTHLRSYEAFTLMDKPVDEWYPPEDEDDE